MSDRARRLIWDFYEEAWGAPMILAVALADAANDSGAGISDSVPDLARKTRQSERAVQQQLRRLESSGLLKCLERSPGGKGRMSQYRLDFTMLVAPANGEPGSGFEPAKPRTAFTVSDAQTPNGVHRLDDHHIKACIKERRASDECVATFTLSGNTEVAEDRRLAGWMLAQIRRLNPNHREPSWSSWCKDIRRMREHDKRTHRQIAELFAWANADPFWQGNVLSPGTLRRQWDRLVIQRTKADPQTSAPAAPDRSCAGRCGKLGTFGERDGKWWCAGCREARQRQGAGA